MLNMNTLQRNQQLMVGGLLLLVLIVTRSDFVQHIQDASWAVFFLAGFYLRSYIHFPLFWLAAFSVDLLSIQAIAGQNHWFTPSYTFLIPAYLSMWFAGRWFAKHYSEDARGVFHFIIAAVSGTLVCFLISNAGFYLLSGHLDKMSVLEYTNSVAMYIPSYLQSTMLYLGLALLVHVAVIAESRVYNRAH